MKLEALVEASVYVGRADGEFSEAELNVFIDRVRHVTGENTGVSELIVLARRARRDLRLLGREAFLARLRENLKSVAKPELLSLVRAIAEAEGVKPEEQTAISELAAD